MKISHRILLINFAIVVLILGSSAFAFYTVLYKTLSSQQSKILLNSANEFIYAYREIVQDSNDEFLYLLKNKPGQIFQSNLEENNHLDFILETGNKNSETIINEVAKNDVRIPSKDLTVSDFIKENPITLINTYQEPGGKYYYYGIILNNTFLNNISKKVNAGIALVWKNTPIEISDESNNQKYSFLLTQVYNNLVVKNNFDIISKSTDSNDILATIYKPNESFKPNNNINYLIFITPSETADLRTSLKYILIIIGSAGIILALILTYLFTGKLRKQISQLSAATKITKEGNFYSKIKVESNDELGQLAGAFNDMLKQHDWSK